MKTIELEHSGAVTWVWLNQPQRLNTINQTTLEELRQTFSELDQNDNVRAVVIAARGPAFSAGFDVSYMAALTPESVAAGLDETRATYDIIEQCSKPVIAAVQGAALGGGLLLALVSDFRLASDRASFGAPEVKIGIFPSLNVIPRLERAVGIGAAKRIVLTGDPINAAEAYRIDLIERIVSADSLHAEAQQLAERLTKLPGTALKLSKAAFTAAQRSDFDNWEKQQFVNCWACPEREAAMRKFLNIKQSSHTSVPGVFAASEFAK